DMRVQSPVQGDLLPQPPGVHRKTLAVLLQGWHFSQFLAQEEFAIEQLDGVFEIRVHGRGQCQILLRGESLAGLPAVALIGEQYGQHLGGAQCTGGGQELPKVRPLALSPELPQPLIRLDGGRRASARGLTHGLPSSSPNSLATRSTARASCLRRAWAVPPSAPAISVQSRPWARSS